MRKNLLKVFCMLALIMSMLIGSMGVYAADTQATGARAILCECGGALGQYAEYGSWRYTGETRICQHGYGYLGTKDQKKTRTKKTYKKCNSCGYRLYVETKNEIGWECMKS